MRKLKYLFLAVIALSAISCAKSEPPVSVVEYGQVCEAANEGKIIAVQGFLNVAETTPCMKMLRLGKDKAMIRECGFRLLDKINVVGAEIKVYVPEGKESNQIETPEAGTPNTKPTSLFPKENLKIRLNDGTVVVPQENVATPVTVTGEVSLTDKNGDGSEKICSIHATKVEKR